MNIGVIASSGGSTFKAFYSILKKSHHKTNFFVISDRSCGIVNFARANKIKYLIIKEPNNTQFSKKAKEELKKWAEVDFIVLFFTRLVTKDLYGSYLVLNLHPSLLPAFKGFRPIKQAIEAGAKFFGTTLHVVDKSTDGGMILAQGISPIEPKSTEKSLEKKSYVQRVYLLLLFVDLFENGAIQKKKNKLLLDYNNYPKDQYFNPALKNKNYNKAAVQLDKKNNSHLFFK